MQLQTPTHGNFASSTLNLGETVLAALKRDVQMIETELYTSRIIKAGALLSDTKTLLAHWDDSKSVSENLDGFRRENVFGKTSRSRTKDVLTIFEQRYLREEGITKALVTLVRNQFSDEAFNRILYFHSARSDRLLHDVVTEILWDFY